MHSYLAEQASAVRLQSLLVAWCGHWPVACSTCQVSASGQMAFAVPDRIVSICEDASEILATK